MLFMWFKIRCYYPMRGFIIFDNSLMWLCIVPASNLINTLLHSSPVASNANSTHFEWSFWRRSCKGLGDKAQASSKTSVLDDINSLASRPGSNMSWKRRSLTTVNKRLQSARMFDAVLMLVVELEAALSACWFSESCRSRKALWRAIKLHLNKTNCWLRASSESDLAVSNGWYFLKIIWLWRMMSNSPNFSENYGITFAICIWYFVFDKPYSHTIKGLYSFEYGE